MIALGRISGSIEVRNPRRSFAAWEMGRTIEFLQSVARHFAVAASQLAAEAGSASRDAARLRAAEALFLAQADDCGLGNRAVTRGPFLRLENGETPSLTVIFACLDDRRRRALPPRSIDRDLVLPLREMLGGLKWYLPDEEEGLELERLPRG